MCRKLFLAVLAVGVITAPSFADAITVTTTSATVNDPATSGPGNAPVPGDTTRWFQGPVATAPYSNIITVSDSAVGVTYTNSFSPTTVTAGQDVRVVGAIPIGSFTQGTSSSNTTFGATPATTSPAAVHTVIAVLALDGSQLSSFGSGSLSAQFTKGTIQIYDHTGTFSGTTPSSWIDGTLLASYSLSYQVGPDAGTHLLGSPAVKQGPNGQQPPIVFIPDGGTASDAAGAQGTTNLLFTKTSTDTLIDTNVPIDPSLINLGTGLIATALTNLHDPNGVTGSDLDPVYSTLLPGLNFQDLSQPGGDYNPGSAPFANGDVFENNVHIDADPVYFTTPLVVPPVPEPATMLAWGLALGGLGVYRRIRKNRKA
jgi:hypothetical protein